LLLNAARPPEPVDCVFSFDSFEHFANPSAVLKDMRSILKPDGQVYISFGPTWLHPLGGHAFTAFPWAHVLLSEEALVRWRNLYFPGSAHSFETSGLNRMTIDRFLHLVATSGLEIERTELVPIRPLRCLHNRVTREWTTSVVRALLRNRN
jgi:SAM-dependent methyltransferase